MGRAVRSTPGMRCAAWPRDVVLSGGLQQNPLLALPCDRPLFVRSKWIGLTPGRSLRIILPPEVLDAAVPHGGGGATLRVRAPRLRRQPPSAGAVIGPCPSPAGPFPRRPCELLHPLHELFSSAARLVVSRTPACRPCLARGGTLRTSATHGSLARGLPGRGLQPLWRLCGGVELDDLFVVVHVQPHVLMDLCFNSMVTSSMRCAPRGVPSGDSAFRARLATFDFGAPRLERFVHLVELRTCPSSCRMCLSHRSASAAHDHELVHSATVDQLHPRGCGCNIRHSRGSSSSGSLRTR